MDILLPVGEGGAFEKAANLGFGEIGGPQRGAKAAVGSDGDFRGVRRQRAAAVISQGDAIRTGRSPAGGLQEKERRQSRVESQGKSQKQPQAIHLIVGTEAESASLANRIESLSLTSRRRR